VKRNRIIAGVLSLLMVLGMFTAYPAITATKVSAASTTNYATSATYRFDAGVATNGTGSFGDGTTYTSYHSGKLNDGTIATGTSNGTTTSVEFGYGTGIAALQAGTATIYYKLSSISTISTVNIFAGRRDNAYRGFFNNARVYVGHSEADINTYNLLGAVSEAEYTNHSGSAYVRNYTVNGVPKTGNYVIIQFDVSGLDASTSAGKGVITLSEVQLWGVSPTLSNLAREADYKYSDTTGANGTTAWGDGTSLTTYKDGKLNNGYIATAASSETTDTAELCVGTVSTLKAGTITVYYKLAQASTVEFVNIFAGRRDNAYRGYFDSASVYVGNSESDVSANTLLGTVTEAGYSSYENSTYVRRYTVNGVTPKTGTYVIIQFNISTTNASTTEGKGILTLSEIQVWGTANSATAITNIASAAQYRSPNFCNGVNGAEGTWGEANFNTYHSGRITDGVVASTYTPSASSTTDRHTIELGVDSVFSAGTAYLYFKLPKSTTITKVNVFANNRDGNATRVYPAALNVYVGNSETDISANTKLGNSSYTSYNTSVRNYTTTGAKTGSYVIVEFSIPDATAPVVAVTEVEIYNGPSTQYDVTFLDKDGGVLKTEKVYEGGSATAPTAPTVEGYDFAGWDKAFTNVTSNITTKATYKIKTFTVNFVGDGGVNLKTETVNYGAAATAPEAPAVAGKTFTGWDVAFDNVKSNLTVNAIYATQTFTVTFIGNEGEVLKTQVVGYGQAATAPEAPVIEGLYFKGWDKAFDNITADTTVTIVYSDEPDYVLDRDFKVTVDANYGKYDTDGDGILDFTGIAVDISVGQITYDRGLLGIEGFLNFDNSILTPLYVTDEDLNGTALDAPPKTILNWPTFTMFGQTAYAIEGLCQAYSMADGSTVDPANPQTKFSKDDSRMRIRYILHTDYYAGYQDGTSIGVLGDGEMALRYYFIVPEGCEGQTFTFTVPDTPEAEHISTCALYAPVSYIKEGTNTIAYSSVYGKGGFAKVTIPEAPKEYTVTFVGKDGETIDTQTVLEGTAATAPEAPAVEGYTFKGWDVAFDNITADTTVTAIYEINTYTVNFVGFDGADLGSQTVEHGSAATAPEAPAVEGYTFTGWDVAFDNVTGDLTVTAVYAINTYTVNFVGFDGADLGSVTVEHGSAATAPEAPAVEGYTFKNWDVAFDNITADTTVTAVYEINKYTVSFVGFDGADLGSVTVEHGSAATAPEAPAVEGYTFKNWDVAFDNITADITVTAVYEINKYTVTFVANGETVMEQTVEYGASATAPEAPAVEGMSFVAWDVAFDNVTADITVTAVYKTNEYVVTFVANGNAIKTDAVEHGAAATAPEAPAVEGYTFKGWDVAFDNITADTTVTAIYEINKYTVTFVANGETINTQTVEHGSAATAPEAPAVEGYTFTGWDVAFDNVTGDITVNAVYEINKYTVTFVANGEVISTETVEHGSAATAPEALAVVGYTFKGWDIAFDNVTGDITVNAVYEINKYTVTFVANGEVISTETVEHGASATAPEVPAVEGMNFAGWDVAFDNVTSDLTVTAQYGEQVFTVTFIGFDGVELQSGPVAYGNAAVAPTAPAVEGYTFKGWDVAFDNITADTTVTAIYEINKYTVSFVGFDGADLGSQTVEHGAAATAPEAPAVEGYTFKGWDVAFDNITADTTVTAIYEINKYTVSFVGFDGADLGSQTVEHGAAATAPEAPAVEGYTFKGWDVAFDNITADTTVTAIYEINKYTVSFVGFDGADLGSQTVEHGAAATAPEAPVVEGFEFKGWDVAFDNVTGDLTVSAIYEEVVAPAEFFTFADNADTTYIALDRTNDIIYFCSGAYTVANFKALFVDADVKIYKAGVEKTSGNVGTAFTVTSTIGSESKTITVVVKGDIDGTGTINARDITAIKNAIAGTAALDAANLLAADLAAPLNGNPNARDITALMNYIAGIATSFAVPSV